MSRANRTVLVLPTVERVISELARLVGTIANESIAARGTFFVGLSGGSLVRFLARGLPDIETDWSKWIFLFCDERVVPSESPDSTFGEYLRTLVGPVPVKEDQFVKISPDLTAESAALDYVRRLEDLFGGGGGPPKLDLVLLGVGEDGHTCSLFPGHALLSETRAWVAPLTDSPKPPPSRITLTLPVINNSRHSVFAATGTAKADIIKLILREDKPLPANLVDPPDGKVHWILDEEAAALLK